MNEGELSGRLGLAGWPAVAEEAIIARDCLLAAHVGSRLHVCHVSTAGSVEIVRWAKAQGLERHRRGLPAPPAAHRRAGRDVRPDLQGQPAAALRRRRRGAAGRPGRRHHRHRRHRPRARTRTRTRTASGRPPRSACSASRPRCRSCRRRWSTPACSTGPASPSGCPTPRRGSAGSPTTAARSRSAHPANVVLYDPARTPHRRPGGVRQPVAQHAVRRHGAARPRGRDVPARKADRPRRQAAVVMTSLAASVDQVAAATGFSGVVRIDVEGTTALENAYGLADRAYGVAMTPYDPDRRGQRRQGRSPRSR